MRKTDIFRIMLLYSSCSVTLASTIERRCNWSMRPAVGLWFSRHRGIWTQPVGLLSFRPAIVMCETARLRRTVVHCIRSCPTHATHRSGQVILGSRTPSCTICTGRWSIGSPLPGRRRWKRACTRRVSPSRLCRRSTALASRRSRVLLVAAQEAPRRVWH